MVLISQKNNHKSLFSCITKNLCLFLFTVTPAKQQDLEIIQSKKSSCWVHEKGDNAHILKNLYINAVNYFNNSLFLF